MPRFSNIADVFDEHSVRAYLFNELMKTDALEPWRFIPEAVRKAKEARLEYERRQAERRWLGTLRFPLKAVAEAAGVRLGLVKKYVREGVRGRGRLRTNKEGNVSLFHLYYFASLHTGRAKDVALTAKDRLVAKSVRRPHSPIRDRQAQNTELSVGEEAVDVKQNQG